MKRAAPDARAVETRIVDQYDSYYLDRTRQQPLPVILALMHDAEETRHYIDPKTATVVRSYSSRPLWDIVVITFMLGGTALCVTALVLAWRAVGKKLRQLARDYGRAGSKEQGRAGSKEQGRAGSKEQDPAYRPTDDEGPAFLPMRRAGLAL